MSLESMQHDPALKKEQKIGWYLLVELRNPML